MPKPRAILKRAKAVKNIAKITNTMRKIAQSRFRRAMNRAVAARPYTDRLVRLIEDLSGAAGEVRHPYLEEREEKRVALLAIASNRGLCGGYNSNVARETLRARAELEGRGAAVSFVVAGKRLAGMLKYQHVPLDAVLTHIDDRPRFEQVDELATRFLPAFEAGKVDALYVTYTRFVSAARQHAATERVLPLARPATAGEPAPAPDVIFSPDPQTILQDLLPRSVRLKLFQAFLDAAVSEQTARMVAMTAATDNANDLIEALTRKYNRSRQAQITTEISEIVGGAAAQE